MIVNIDDPAGDDAQPRPPTGVNVKGCKENERIRRQAAETARLAVARNARGLVVAVHDAVRLNPWLTEVANFEEIWRELRALVPDLQREHDATRALADALGVPFLRTPLVALGRRRERAS